MKARGWIVTGLVVFGVGSVARGGCLNGGSKAPDEKLAGNFVELCEIARGNVETPEKGVKKLGRYLVKHADDMLGALGGTLATVEKIADDDKHDARARLARERIHAPMRACEKDWYDFFEAVDESEEATAALQYGVDRLGRTIEIIFGTSVTTTNVRELPRQLADQLAR